jgi:hypothetical protein
MWSSAMEFKGYVDKGWIKPTEPISLPEGTPVVFSAAKTRASTVRTRKATEQVLIHGWKSQPLADLSRSQGTTPLKSLDQLAGDWPDSNSIDDFLKSVRKGRK